MGAWHDDLCTFIGNILVIST